MLDFTKKIKNLKGEFIPKSFNTQKELDKLPRIKIDGKETKEPDMKKLEDETIGNIVINCLGNYVAKKDTGKKEGFYCNIIAQSIIDSKKKFELKDKYKKFLIEVLDDSILKYEEQKNEKGQKIMNGIYPAWEIAQALEELGYEPD